jgi:hypothetical protein
MDVTFAAETCEIEAMDLIFDKMFVSNFLVYKLVLTRFPAVKVLFS